MVNKCCVPKCKSNYLSIRKDATFENITVFRFPKDEVIRNKWKRNIPREFSTITRNTVVCVKHFYEEDIIRFKKSKPGENVKVCTITCIRIRVTRYGVVDDFNLLFFLFSIDYSYAHTVIFCNNN